MTNEINKLPEYFKPILWSYDFSKLDIQSDKKTVIISALNYGDLKHWRWIINQYGKSAITEIIENTTVSEIRKKALPLVAIIFEVSHFNYAPRSTHR